MRPSWRWVRRLGGRQRGGAGHGGRRPPEVKKIRLVHAPAICLSPQYIAEELLRLEGFSDIEYVDTPVAKSLTLVEAGRADMTMNAWPDVVAALDAGRSLLPL